MQQKLETGEYHRRFICFALRFTIVKAFVFGTTEDVLFHKQPTKQQSFDALAVFAFKNASVKPGVRPSLTEPYNYTVHLDDTPLAIGSLEAGWPIAYWHATGTTSAGRVYLATYPTYRLWTLVGNTVMCVASVVLASVLVNRLHRRSRPCPKRFLHQSENP